MSDKETDLKEAIKKIILLQREKSVKSLQYYKELYSKLSKDSLYNLEKDTPFYDSLDETVPLVNCSPVYILETAISTFDEYIEALNNFSRDQLSAFLLGLGLNWIPLRYWGVKELDNYMIRLERSIKYYDELKQKIPSVDIEELKIRNNMEALPSLNVSYDIWASDLQRTIKQLVEGMIDLLEDRPF